MSDSHSDAFKAYARKCGIVDDYRAAVDESLANHIGIVLVRPATEGVEVNPHGRTVSPSSATLSPRRY